MNKYMKIASDEAINGINNNFGGPFGSVIVLNGKVISKGSNRVLIDNDPTSHGEIVAIRRACQKLNTYDLSGCILYTNAYPCPMCLSAIIWANIKVVYYGCTCTDADKIGFRDDVIYQFINGKNNLLELKNIDREECLTVFKKYQEKNGIIY